MATIPVEQLVPIELPPILQQRRSEARCILAQQAAAQFDPYIFLFGIAAVFGLTMTGIFFFSDAPLFPTVLLAALFVIGAAGFVLRGLALLGANQEDSQLTRWARNFVQVTDDIDELNATMHDVLVYAASHRIDTVFCEAFIDETVQLAAKREQLEELLMVNVRGRADITVNRMMGIRSVPV